MILLKIIFTQNESSNFIEEEFRKYLIKFNKTYSSKEEYSKRLNLFNSSFNKVINHNKNHSFKYSLNKFSDFTVEEKKKYKSGNIIKLEEKSNKKYPFVINIGGDHSDKDIDKEDMDLPESFDYRKLGAVNEVVDQGICGSCSVFSIVSSIEGYYFMKEEKLKKFSEQQIIDCIDKNICVNGASGLDILKYVKKNGIMEYNDYPYVSGETGYKTRCKYNKNNVVAKISYYKLVDKPKAKNIKKYLYKYGPISSAINSECIEGYAEGIVDYSKKECGNSLDDVSHGVSIVGWDYDNKTSTEYWIVKNSWGKEWGMDGYMYVKYGENTIGIERQIYFVCSKFIKIQNILFYFIFLLLFL